MDSGGIALEFTSCCYFLLLHFSHIQFFFPPFLFKSQKKKEKSVVIENNYRVFSSYQTSPSLKTRGRRNRLLVGVKGWLRDPRDPSWDLSHLEKSGAARPVDQGVQVGAHR